MDSLLANYASSDEEDHEEQQPRLAALEKLDENKDGGFLPISSSKRGGIFGSLPPPTKSSLFNSLPPRKSQPLPKSGERDDITKPKSSSSSSLFSSLPAPKSSASLSSSSTSKKVVQFRPPTMMNASRVQDDDDDEDDEDEKERERKRSKAALSTASATSFLSSIPAPKHSGATLGAAPSGTGRRSMLEMDTPASSASAVSNEVVNNTNDGYMKDQSSETVYDYSSWTDNHGYYSGYDAVQDGSVGLTSNVGQLGNQSLEVYSQSKGESYAYYGSYGVSSSAGGEAVDYSCGGEQNVEYTNYDGSSGDYVNNAQYEDSWAAFPEASGVVENVLQVPGKRGRKDIPPEMIEVKQDELIKNRPREDQVKLTGIAFGPAHQPTSTKGKPTKLHKRKHQIGSLYFDMKQKEMELAERRAQGFLTKAQTQAKYGW